MAADDGGAEKDGPCEAAWTEQCNDPQSMPTTIRVGITPPTVPHGLGGQASVDAAIVVYAREVPAPAPAAALNAAPPSSP